VHPMRSTLGGIARSKLSHWGAVASIISLPVGVVGVVTVFGWPADEVAAPILAFAVAAVGGVVVIRDIRRGTAKLKAAHRVASIRSSAAFEMIRCRYRREEQAVGVILQILAEEHSGEPSDADLKAFLDAFPDRLVHTDNALGLCDITLDQPPGIGRRIGNVLRTS